MDTSAPQLDQAAIERARCHECSYELVLADLASQGYRCPECGQINIPNDAAYAPCDLRPVPGLWRITLALCCWPGMVLAILTVIVLRAATPYAMIALIVIMLAAPLTLLFPVVACDYFRKRVPRRQQRFGRSGAILGGVIANAALIYLGIWIASKLP